MLLADTGEEVRIADVRDAGTDLLILGSPEAYEAYRRWLAGTRAEAPDHGKTEREAAFADLLAEATLYARHCSA